MHEDERRANSIEAVLISLGELKSSSSYIKEIVDKLDNKVGIQNGRVGKLERWQAYTQGAVMILAVIVIPIIINFVSSWLKQTFQS